MISEIIKAAFGSAKPNPIHDTQKPNSIYDTQCTKNCPSYQERLNEALFGDLNRKVFYTQSMERNEFALKKQVTRFNQVAHEDGHCCWASMMKNVTGMSFLFHTKLYLG